MAIYWFTGVIGAGKSTLGAALAASLPETDFIDGDFCYIGKEEHSFETRVEKKHQYLNQKCIEYARANKNLVIAYPTALDLVDRLRTELEQHQSELIVIAIQGISPNGGTRMYSEWEQNRQIEMTHVCGDGYADIFFTHPTCYLYDSLKSLRTLLGL